VPEGEVQARNHSVVHTKTNRSIPYAQLIPLLSSATAPNQNEIRFKTPAQFRYIGKDIPIADLDDLVRGKGTFGIDARMPGMVYAAIERPPVMGAKLRKVDDSGVKQVSGVQQVVMLDLAQPPLAFKALGGAAVIANSTWAALQGRRQLKVDWEIGENGSYDSAAYRRSMDETARKPGRVAREMGNVDNEFSRSDSKVVEASYYTPLLAHAPMEPPAAVAEFKDGKVVTWANTQNPQAVQDTVAKALGISKDNVICHVTLLGGGFGRKSKPDYVAEAALLSRQVGKPVKIVWSREDDIQFDYYHSPASLYMKAALGERGKPTAWLQRSVFPPIAMRG
jgi:isoquinoline 1-oxidoreductase beta subunit